MMRENDQTQRTKTQNELVSERKTPISSSSNIPLMAMTPISATVTTSSAYLKDLTSNLFEQNPPKPIYSMSTSQTMPSLIRPTMVQQQPKRPMPNTNDLTASLLNNINSLTSRPQTSPTVIPYSGTTSGGMGLFQPPPPPGSMLVKGMNVPNTKTAAAELDDLFN
jgi:hypothetical protein